MLIDRGFFAETPLRRKENKNNYLFTARDFVTIKYLVGATAEALEMEIDSSVLADYDNVIFAVAPSHCE